MSHRHTALPPESFPCRASAPRRIPQSSLFKAVPEIPKQQRSARRSRGIPGVLPPRNIAEQLSLPMTEWQEQAGTRAAQHELVQRTRR